MSTVDIARAQTMLRSGLPVAVVAEALGVTARTLGRAFGAAGLPQPKTWQLAEVGVRDDGAHPVSFRLPEYAELAEAAKSAGLKPSEYARNVVQAHLRRLQKKR